MPSAPSPSHPRTRNSRRARILLAEDDRELRRLLARVLRDDGYDVFEVANGDELVDHIETSLLRSDVKPRPDLLITDVTMPGLSGLKALQILIESECLPRAIVITAFPSEETRSLALSFGAIAIFDKPFDVDDLRREVADQLGEPRPTA